jgi:ECF sigma factor
MLTPGHNLIGLDEALSQPVLIDAWGAELVKLRLYVELSLDKATATLGVVRRTAKRDWAFARAPDGNHPPGYQALERARNAGRRPAGAQDDRLWNGEAGANRLPLATIGRSRSGMRLREQCERTSL